jgi:hypothetical protein
MCMRYEAERYGCKARVHSNWRRVSAGEPVEELRMTVRRAIARGFSRLMHSCCAHCCR